MEGIDLWPPGYTWNAHGFKVLRAQAKDGVPCVDVEFDLEDDGSVPNHGKLWKSLMRAHLGDREAMEARRRRQQRVFQRAAHQA